MQGKFLVLMLMVFTVATEVGLVAAGEQPTPRSAVLIHPEYVDFAATAAAFGNALTPSSQLTAPVGGLLNHHLLAASFIRDTLNEIRPGSIQHIILISPNHFLAGRAAIQSADEDFATPYGVVHVDQAAGKQLVANSAVRVENETFIREHGIYNILPYIARQLPWATVTPIIIKFGTPASMLSQLRHVLDGRLRPGTLVLGSFDDSHYLTSAAADAQDAITLRSIDSIGRDTSDPLYVDSPEGLRLVLQLVEDAGAHRFQLTHHSNSAKLTNNLTAVETTSYITGLFFR